MTILFSDDKQTGIKTVLHEDRDRDGDFIVQKSVDVEPILDACHDARVQMQGKRSGELMHAGKIPLDVFGRLLQKANESNVPVGHLAMQWLRENPVFKTTEKRI